VVSDYQLLQIQDLVHQAIAAIISNANELHAATNARLAAIENEYAATTKELALLKNLLQNQGI
jgi:hypothetical protein